MEALFSLPEEAKPDRYIHFDKDDIEQSVPDRFEKQVELFPDNLALKHGTLELTYHELNCTANQLASLISEKLKKGNNPIAFLLGHGFSQITTIFGILKTGNAYVALDPEFPNERLSFIFNDSPCENLGIKIAPDTNATILYTSGSTGQPKGCIRPHRNLLHGIMGDTNRLFLNPKDKIGLFLSASFAAFEVPTFGTLLNGASLFPFDIKREGLLKFAQWLKAESITILVTVPSAFRNIVASSPDPETFASLRVLFMGGESVLKGDVDLYNKYLPPNCYLNVVLVGSEFQRIRSYIISKSTVIFGGMVPVGYPVEDKDVFLLDNEGKKVEIGEVGEITVQSRFLTPGYWNNPELTKETFSSVPNQDGVRQYRTGDLGRMDSDGCLLHLGRLDFQVKILGHRVELNEITTSLLDIPSVVDAVVIANPDSSGIYQLIAYIVLGKGVSTDSSKLREHLSDKLPTYMLPSKFVILDELPKTPTGKVDINGLPEAEKIRTKADRAETSHRKPLEEKLVEIWGDLLDYSPVGINDEFFEQGGHSLLALRLIAKIEEEINISVPFPALIKNPTIRKLANLINDKVALDSWSHMVALQPKGEKPPFYCVPPSAVTSVIFADLVKYWDTDRPFLAMEHMGLDGETSPHTSIPEMARYNLNTIRSIQPKGPYYLGGMCFGGLVAYEMAQQLLADGEDVPFLGILDSTHAPYLTRPRSYPIFILTRYINQKILRGKFPIGMAPLKRAMKKFSPGDEIGHRVYQVFTSHNFARVKYTTKPFPGTITLFNTAGSRGDFSRDQWETVTDGELKIVSIPGAHAGARVDLKEREQSFVHEPMVQVLAQRLNESLEALDQRVSTVIM